MYIILWRYKVEVKSRHIFEKFYKDQGKWAKLFSLSSGYKGTRLLNNNEGDYITIDHWDLKENFDQFKKDYFVHYQNLDHQCHDFTLEEQYIGSYYWNQENGNFFNE
ncbi:MAG: hypothetical protein K1X44_01995 [Alphaproteobacteria bacterium]|nr:hypothetical protein [Alphaproteobacteria bacterium]